MILLRRHSRLFLSICFGVFLFILFFEPFPVEMSDFEDRLLLYAGLGIIVFFLTIFSRVFFPWIVQKKIQIDKEPAFLYLLGGFVLFASTSVTFAFYLHYVAAIDITLYIMFRVLLVSLAAPVVLMFHDRFVHLSRKYSLLLKENKMLQNQTTDTEADDLKKTIELHSESGREVEKFAVADIAVIFSANNYIELLYRDRGEFKKKLIRNTLKNIEQLVKPYSNFIRVHRTSIVNTHFIEKLNRDYYKHWLSIKGYKHDVPVSRQYILKLKESL